MTAWRFCAKRFCLLEAQRSIHHAAHRDCVGTCDTDWQKLADVPVHHSVWVQPGDKGAD